jgi:hypothetical protein
MTEVDVPGPPSRIYLCAMVSRSYKLWSKTGPGRTFFSEGEEHSGDGEVRADPDAGRPVIDVHVCEQIKSQ